MGTLHRERLMRAEGLEGARRGKAFVVTTLPMTVSTGRPTWSSDGSERRPPNGLWAADLTGKVIRVHPIRHDCSRELGAFANTKGRPRRAARAEGFDVSGRSRSQCVVGVPRTPADN